MFVPVPYVATAMPSVIYPPVIGTSATGTMMYRPFLIPEQTAPINQDNKTTNKSVDRKRPASQATSIKAEPGSTMAMSESSKKVCLSLSLSFSLSAHLNKYIYIYMLFICLTFVLQGPITG